jgi:2-polyprenyl-3-methyl-5-hydroxy-6-metoxy-1,4-benzoquinol methylase
MITIETLAELDKKIDECAAAGSDSELRSLFRTFKMKRDLTAGDPFSQKYADEQLSLYRHVSGRPYELKNEETKFDIDSIEYCPFPYSTGSVEVIGNQLLAIGSLLRKMRIKKGDRLLEFGPGWGNTTMTFAQAGINVTAVDIEKRFCELLKRRAAQLDVTVDIVNADFMWAENVSDPYDAVVFFECFHHCADHMRLLKALQKTLKTNGRIYFLGEPITHQFAIPWGLRLDGESLWAVRKHGWLELGFNETYFKKALERAGWRGIKHQAITTTATVWEVGRVGEFNPSFLDVMVSRLFSRCASVMAVARDIMRRRKK